MQTPLVLTSLQLAKALIGLDANVKMANPHNAMQTRALFSKKKLWLRELEPWASKPLKR
jgi:hypothetical protein